jgi:hypothetical protein
MVKPAAAREPEAATLDGAGESLRAAFDQPERLIIQACFGHCGLLDREVTLFGNFAIVHVRKAPHATPAFTGCALQAPHEITVTNAELHAIVTFIGSGGGPGRELQVPSRRKRGSAVFDDKRAVIVDLPPPEEHFIEGFTRDEYKWHIQFPQLLNGGKSALQAVRLTVQQCPVQIRKDNNHHFAM